MLLVIFSLIFLLLPLGNALLTFDEYLKGRSDFMAKEENLSINAAWKLTAEEAAVDKILSHFKMIDLNLDPVPVQFNFKTMQATIDDSQLFALLQSTPKGALLHSHDVSSQDMHFYVEASYLDGCLFNVGNSSDYGSLSFSKLSDDYVPISDIRRDWPGGAEVFDQELYYNFTIIPYMDIPDTTGDYMWSKFQPIFSRVDKVYQYLPVFRKYYRLMFDKLHNDGITRWEMRTSLSGVYDANGVEYTAAESVGVILDVLEDWKAEDYAARGGFSFGIIMQGIRSASVEEVTSALVTTYELRDIYPDIVVGFDLVGQEDPGKTLLYWAPILLAVEESMNSTMPFFFHAGESNELRVQENLVDSVFLNTSRIGHGFGVQEFPGLWPLLSEKHILIESCPVSNQVLGLVVDQRNHPVGQMLHHSWHNIIQQRDTYSPKLQELLARHPNLFHVVENLLITPSLTVAISNDDPGFWGIDAIVSYDWYIAVLAWDLSLGGIKQLAIDSIVHSAASLDAKAEMLSRWSAAWNKWIASFQH